MTRKRPDELDQNATDVSRAADFRTRTGGPERLAGDASQDAQAHHRPLSGHQGKAQRRANRGVRRGPQSSDRANGGNGADRAQRASCTGQQRAEQRRPHAGARRRDCCRRARSCAIRSPDHAGSRRNCYGQGPIASAGDFQAKQSQRVFDRRPCRARRYASHHRACRECRGGVVGESTPK